MEADAVMAEDGRVRDAERLRMSVLHINKDSDLPLPYVYLPDQSLFRTMGYVRLRRVTVWEGVSHLGPDTPEERDTFLLKVLVSLLVSTREARRIVRTADHLPGSASSAGAVPAAAHEEFGGTHLSGWGLVAGLLLGLLVGGLLSGWDGAAIGAFVGASTVIDLFTAGWQVVHAHSPRNYVEIHDTLALLMVTVGTIAGGVLGYLLGGGGFGQARGVFLGMALAAFILSLLATAFSMVRFRQRSMTWLGPLIVGAFAWGAYALWSNPVSLAAGIVLGSVVAGALAPRVNGADW